LNIQFSADGKRVALGARTPDSQSFTQVWQLGADPKVVAEFPKSSGGGIFALSPSGKRVVVRGVAMPEAFDVDSHKSLGKLPAGTFSHAFFRDEDTVVYTQCSHNFPMPSKGKITVWDVAKNKDAGSFEIPDDRFSAAMPARNASEFWLFMSAGRFEVECYDLAAKKLTRTVHPEPAYPNQPYTYAGFSQSVAPDGSAFASSVGMERIYDGETGKIVAQLPGGLYGMPGGPGGLVPGGSRFLAMKGGVPDKGGVVKYELILIDWKTGKSLAALADLPTARTGQGGPVAAVSADGRTAVVVSKAGEGLVFDLSSVK
jgi:hypothetical protein